MTLRGRLTLLIGGALLVALVGFGIALYLALAQLTLRVANDALASEATRLRGEKGFSLATIVEPPSNIGLPATYVQTLSVAGEPLAHSSNLASFALPLSAEGLAAVQRGAAWSEIVPKGEKRLLVYSAPVRSGEEVAGVLQVGRSLADRDDALASLRGLLIGGGLLTLAIAGLLAWLLASTALRPLGRITRAAQAIGERRAFAERLPAPATRDEVGALATTLNGMLAELDGAHEQVEHALQAQRRLVADASHELRTPLTTIRGYLALLERDPPIAPADARVALQSTIAETDRLIRLVNQLFLLARSDAGQIAYQRVAVPLAPLAARLVAQSRLRAPERAISLHVPAYLAALGDADALWQVLLNLVENALVHTPPSAPIAIEGRVADGAAELSVSDGGPGIAAEQLPQLFDRFARGDVARSGEGAGLGLAIARTTTEALGGTLTATSAPGRGSRFILRLPVAPPVR